VTSCIEKGIVLMHKHTFHLFSTKTRGCGNHTIIYIQQLWFYLTILECKADFFNYL
jgi:hypothetical protein